MSSKHDRYSRAKRGEKSPSAKLKVYDVKEIRMRLARGEKYRDLALEYEVTWQNVNAIDQGKTWVFLLSSEEKKAIDQRGYISPRSKSTIHPSRRGGRKGKLAQI